MTVPTASFDGVALLQALPDAAILIDPQLRIAHVNAAAQKLIPSLALYETGSRLSRYIRHPEILSLAEACFTDPEPNGTADGATGGATNNNAGNPASVRVTLPGHVDRRLSVSVAPIAASNGLPYALMLMHDDTAIWRTEKMRGDFIANVSHELRTPIASVIGYIETLQGPARDDDRARAQFLDIMNDQAQRMSRLIDDLLSLSRIEIDEHIPPASSVQLMAVIQKAIDVVTPLLDAEAVKLTCDIDPDAKDLTLPGVEDELVQMLQNLLDNAVKYGADKGKVIVSAAIDPDGDTVRLSVQDFGKGIAPEHLPRLTERFYRVSAPASRARGGTGLGLAIVKHIVNRHSAMLQIESEVGVGSRFNVLLPLAGKASGAGKSGLQIDVVSQLP